jgi:hypothetical protein
MGDDQDLTSTVEEQLADEGTREDAQTQPLSEQDLKDPEVEPLSEDQLQEENAETSLDQPSDSTS